jgi:hypothetical protein
MSLLQSLGTIINGVVYDQSSVSIQITPTAAGGVVGKAIGAAAGALGASSLFAGVTEISYSDSLEPGIFRAIGSPEKLGMTRGIYDCEASLSMEKRYAQALMDTLATMGGGGYGTVPFQVVVSYADIGLLPITDTLEGCRITKAEDQVQQGSSDALVVKLELALIKVLRNGVGMLGSLGGAVGGLIP